MPRNQQDQPNVLDRYYSPDQSFLQMAQRVNMRNAGLVGGKPASGIPSDRLLGRGGSRGLPSEPATPAPRPSQPIGNAPTAGAAPTPTPRAPGVPVPYPGGGGGGGGGPSGRPIPREPIDAGLPHLTRTLGDPYDVNDARLRTVLDSIERAYQVAGQRTGAQVLGSGAAEGGVSRGTTGNVETSRARSIAEAVRDYEQFAEMLGDERLRNLLLPLLLGQSPTSSSTGDTLDTLGQLLGLLNTGRGLLS